MLTRIKLSELSLDDLHIEDVLDKYNMSFDSAKTIGDNIYDYLNSNKGFIQHKRHVNVPFHTEEQYRESLRITVSKGSPIILFLSAFSPKVTNPSITNHHFLPDMGDLLTLVHLHLLAKHVRSFYDYGFRFIIGYKGSLYQPIMQWTDIQVKESYETLQSYIKVAERITGVRNVVEIIDIMELVEREGSYFNKQWEEEQKAVRELYEQNDPYTVRKINGWIDDYQKAMAIPSNWSPKELYDFLLDKAIYIRALKHIQFRGGFKNEGICNSLPPIVQSSTRGIDPSISLQLNPFFRFHPHQRLIRFNATSRNWETFQWHERAETTQPVLCDELNQPFYYN